jgi:hypothetical protein
MRLFHPVNRLFVTRNLWLVLLIKIWLFLKLVKHASKSFYNSKYSKYMFILPLALVVAELLVLLWFFTKYKLQNISGTHAEVFHSFVKKNMNDMSTRFSIKVV